MSNTDPIKKPGNSYSHRTPLYAIKEIKHLRVNPHPTSFLPGNLLK